MTRWEFLPVVLVFVLTAFGSRYAWGIQGRIPEPPEPPELPPGVNGRLRLNYYGTCGWSHAPTKITINPILQISNLLEYDMDSAMEYSSSPEMQAYLKEVTAYVQKYGLASVARVERSLRGPTLDSFMFKSSADAAESDTGRVWTSGNGTLFPQRLGTESSGRGGIVKSSGSANPSQENPLLDLATWMRRFQYHEDLPSYISTDSGPERAVSLVAPDAGPAPASGLYGRLLAFLPGDGATPPTPAQLLSGLDPLWKTRWRTALGFDADPYNKQLLADAGHARKLADAAQNRLDELRRSAGTDSDAAARLKAQIASAQRDLDAAQAKAKETSDALFRRLKFVEALVELLRLAPNGGFGPDFDTADLDAVQKSATRILAELGALAGNLAWTGLAEDLAWIEANSGDRNSAGFSRRVRGVSACEALLADPRVEGLAAVCDFVAAGKPASPSLLRKAFELIERLGTDRLRPEVLRTLPRLLELCSEKDSGVRERAHMLVLRILKVRGGGVSLEAAIGTLAPLTVSKDAELARAALGFLRANTGMDFGAEPRKWQALQAEMRGKRLATP